MIGGLNEDRVFEAILDAEMARIIGLGRFNLSQIDEVGGAVAEFAGVEADLALGYPATNPYDAYVVYDSVEPPVPLSIMDVDESLLVMNLTLQRYREKNNWVLDSNWSTQG